MSHNPEFEKDEHGHTDAQEVFDYVVGSLFKQGEQSMDSSGSCRYRGENGCMCAIGWLIPDDDYQGGLEGKCVTGHHPLVAILKNLGHTPHMEMLFQLQSVHDNYTTTANNWRSKFETLASELNLKWNF